MNRILDAIREYELTYGQAPTHLTLSVDEQQELERDLGRPIPVGYKLFGLVEIRVNDNTPAGKNMLQPTRGLK